MLITSRFHVVTILFVFLLLILSSCSNKEPDQSKKEESGQAKLEFGGNSDTSQADSTSQVAADPYMGWQRYTKDNLILFYPPDYTSEDSIHQLAELYQAIIRKGSQFLQIQEPTEQIAIFLHKTVGEGRNVTGHMFTYAEGGEIHYWPPYNYGLAVMDYLLPKWVNKQTGFPFLKQGIRRLIDASGRNFHKMTLDYIDSGMFVPLNELAMDTSLLADTEFLRTSLAASFVDFSVYYYGMPKFKELYTSDFKFDKAVNKTYGITIDSLQTLWLSVIKKAMNKE